MDLQGLLKCMDGNAADSNLKEIDNSEIKFSTRRCHQSPDNLHCSSKRTIGTYIHQLTKAKSLLREFSYSITSHLVSH